MRKTIFIMFILTAWACQSNASSRPNIIVILADDMGFSDIGCYGGEIETPNLDKLAGKGIRFTRFYNSGRCCPTRASLMTGLHPHETGIGWMTNIFCKKCRVKCVPGIVKRCNAIDFNFVVSLLVKRPDKLTYGSVVVIDIMIEVEGIGEYEKVDIIGIPVMLHEMER